VAQRDVYNDDMRSSLVFALQTPSGAAILAVIGIIVVIFISLATWASRYMKVADVLSLELLTIALQLKEVSTKGLPVEVIGIAQIKIEDDDLSIVRAAKHFLGKGPDAIKNIAVPALERHLCTLLATMSVEEIQPRRGMLGSRIRELAAADMAGPGLGILDVTLREVREPAQ
jgi:uncharacterized membrane protein YqiK